MNSFLLFIVCRLYRRFTFVLFTSLEHYPIMEVLRKLVKLSESSKKKKKGTLTPKFRL
jgi:hypothetical protein